MAEPEQALRDLGWGDPVPDLAGGDDDDIKRNHTHSWLITEIPAACAHTLLTLGGLVRQRGAGPAASAQRRHCAVEASFNA